MKKLNFFPTKKSTQFFLTVFFCITLIFSVLTGCDDEASSEAKLFDAEEALDDGNWAKALSILNSLGTSEEVLQYLSNAYAGQVGINTFDLLTTIDELDSANGGTDNSGSIDMIGKLIGAENDVLTCSNITTKLETISDAIDSMNRISALFGTLDDDQAVQLGLASLTRTVLVMAKLICEETSSDEIKMTKEWIQTNRDGFLPISLDTWNSSTIVDDDSAVVSYATMLFEDITNVGNAVSVMATDNDIREDFDVFKTEIDNGYNGSLDEAGNNVITRDELNQYMGTM